MLSHYTILELQPNASLADIKTAYNRLKTKAESLLSLSDTKALDDAYFFLSDAKNSACQLQQLITGVKEIIKQYGKFYLQYDTHYKDESGSAVFDLPFYATGEAIKYCQFIVALYEEKKDLFIEDSMPLILKAFLSKAQCIHQLDYYDPEDEWSSDNYVCLLQLINGLYKKISPPMALENIALFEQNIPRKRTLKCEKEKSTLPEQKNNIYLLITDLIQILPSASLGESVPAPGVTQETCLLEDSAKKQAKDCRDTFFEKKLKRSKSESPAEISVPEMTTNNRVSNAREVFFEKKLKRSSSEPAEQASASFARD